MRASEEKAAERLRARGWTCDPPEGKRFPTSLRHFMDYCRPCRDGGMPAHAHTACVPHRREPEETGGTYFYRCPQGHEWTCWYGDMPGYHSDCPCDYCWSARDDNGEEHWPAIIPYNVAGNRAK